MKDFFEKIFVPALCSIFILSPGLGRQADAQCPPHHDKFEFEVNRTIPAGGLCSVELSDHFIETDLFSGSQFDEDCNFEVENHHTFRDGSLSNPLNGKVVRYSARGKIRPKVVARVFDENGTGYLLFDFPFSGLSQTVRIPGEGAVVVNAGRSEDQLQVFFENGEFVDETFIADPDPSGRWGNDALPQICSYLELDE